MSRAFIAASLLCVVAAITTAQTPNVSLAVPGRANVTPWVAAEGNFVAVTWGAAVPSGGSDVFVAVSRDRGHSFAPPVQVNARNGEGRVGGELPPRVQLARSDAGGDPDVIVVWGAKGEATEMRVSISRDGGKSFAPPVVASAPAAPGDRGWQASAVDSRGVLHTIWLDHRGLATRAKSEHDHRGDGTDMAQHSGLYYAALPLAPSAPTTAHSAPGTSSARGTLNSALLPASAERELLKGVCFCCKTSPAIGLDGTLYAAWRHVYPGNIRDIAFTFSRDGGKTFAAPVRVSADNWQLAGCPDDGPDLAVSRDGLVHIVWPTVIGAETPRGALFYATTRDGRQFSPRVEVPTFGTPKPSHPQIAAAPDGSLLVAWDEVRDAVRRAATTTLTRSNGQARFSTPTWIDGEEPSAYPVLAETSDSVIAAWTSGRPGATTIAVRQIAGAR